MMKNWENNGTGEIGLVTPTSGGLLKDHYAVLEEHKFIVKLYARTSLVSTDAKTLSQY